MADSQGPIRLSLEPISPSVFAPFGNVVYNPARAPSSWQAIEPGTDANQGTATKYSDVTSLASHYNAAPSRTSAQPRVSLFSCRPRQLSSALDPSSSTLPYPGTTKTLRVPILERHPYTTQTFVPLSLDAAERFTAYIVVVAPTLPATRPHRRRPPPYPTDAPPRSSAASRANRPPPYPTDKPSDPRGSDRPPPYPTDAPPRPSVLRRIFARARPEPFTNAWGPPSSDSQSELRNPIYSAPSPNSPSDFGPAAATPIRPSFASLSMAKARAAEREEQFRPRGPGQPDLARARAFVCSGGQAVTYAPGTWHAPMIVVGERDIDFVVLQWANGVAAEDCQEVKTAEGELNVVVEEGAFGLRTGIGSSARPKL